MRSTTRLGTPVEPMVPWNDAPMLPPGTPLALPRGLVIEDGAGGAWRVLRRIGSGGVGSVFEAAAVAGGRRVAIKVVHPAWAGLEEVRQRFRREVAALATIDSPRVVAILGSGQVETAYGELPYLVMELVCGPTVAELIARGPLSPRRAIAIGAGALNRGGRSARAGRGPPRREAGEPGGGGGARRGARAAAG